MVFHEVCVPRPGVEKALLVRPNDAQRRTLGKTMPVCTGLLGEKGRVSASLDTRL